MDKKVLIVDDEDGVVKSIAGVLEDEGFGVIKAKNGEEALSVFSQEEPVVTLLDIWMPGMDGIEVLKRLKGVAPECLVIMLSGHATISMAMAAVKIGAFDFIEKPFSLDVLLMTVRQAISYKNELLKVGRSGKSISENHPLKEKIATVQVVTDYIDELPLSSYLNPVSYIKKKSIKKMATLSRQRTLKRSKVLYGKGLHSGMKTGLLLQPLPPNSGILFGNVFTEDIVPLHVDYVQTTQLATSLRKGMAVAKTIEHLMAVFHAYRITNLMVKMIEEIPIMDGSALEFCKLIQEAGVEEQEEMVEELVIDHPIEISNGNKSLTIEPADVFSVRYFLDYPFPVGQQTLEFTLENEEEFTKEIAPARTFAFLKDMEQLERRGLGEGGGLHNFILVDNEKVVNTELRFPDEFVRHKILDIIGDFYLLNRPIRGKITARLTGHTDNFRLMKRLFEESTGKR
jgi:UDP-3-O-[3-hydroxymyristoyl] N-acetylglucosamine deacetylase